MKKILMLVLFSIFAISFISCSDNTTDPVEEKGNLIVNSTPAGAKIFLDGTDSGFLTPYTFSGKAAGTYTVTLKLDTYADTTINAQVVNNQDATLNVNLKPTYTKYESIKIYETTGTNSSQPSGLILSTGTAISSSNAGIDIYYYSSSDGSTYLVQSANANNSAKRATYFKISSATNLNDGTDSPAKDATWTNSMSDREANYVFLYDADGHYSKLKISNYGGGSGVGDPAWVELTWIFNKAVDNKLF
ncbi:MAG: PEGA domain-containing protein [Ignavibacteriales bacterium]|nr:PEGA domain-containing protein [Ignavibacteriales bacterium]MBK7980827.1 PEGA domain-containing protein [Ignavibacteriota bacterium]